MATEVTVTMRFEEYPPPELVQELEYEFECIVVAGPEEEEV